MHTYSSAYTELSKALQAVYDNREAAAIAHEAMEHITGATRLERITDRDKALTAHQQLEYDRVVPLLLGATPLQYIFGSAWFMGREYRVNEQVLIPRPETEELVQWITEEYKGKQVSILDIGTGSGCIPISLQLGLPGTKVTSIDISTGALEIAKQNAESLGADVTFQQFDFLSMDNWNELGQYDVIVSNPPYIPETERETLHANVRDHEPGQALFVPGDDAQLFYRHIAQFGLTHLKEGGAVYCELHVDHAVETEYVFTSAGYSYTELREDMHGNLRMLKAKK